MPFCWELLCFNPNFGAKVRPYLPSWEGSRTPLPFGTFESMIFRTSQGGMCSFAGGYFSRMISLWDGFMWDNRSGCDVNMCSVINCLHASMLVPYVSKVVCIWGPKCIPSIRTWFGSNAGHPVHLNLNCAFRDSKCIQSTWFHSYKYHWNIVSWNMSSWDVKYHDMPNCSRTMVPAPSSFSGL